MAAVGLVTSLLLLRPLRRAEIEGASMVPTLLPGDRILLRRRLGSSVRPGDLVGFADPRPGRSQLLVKRVATIAGDQVTVLGDNRHGSTDSRDFGPIALKAISWIVVRRYARSSAA